MYTLGLVLFSLIYLLILLKALEKSAKILYFLYVIVELGLNCPNTQSEVICNKSVIA